MNKWIRKSLRKDIRKHLRNVLRHDLPKDFRSSRRSPSRLLLRRGRLQRACRRFMPFVVCDACKGPTRVRDLHV